MRSILITLGLLSICSSATAATVPVLSERVPRMAHFHFSVFADGVEVDGPSPAHRVFANRDRVRYEGLVVDDLLSVLDIVPTGGDEEWLGAQGGTIDGRTFRVQATGGHDGVTLHTRFGSQQSTFVPYPDVWPEPLTVGAFLDVGPEQWEVGGIEGPWHSPVTTIFADTLGGVDYEFVLDRFGWFATAELNGTEPVLLTPGAIPEPSAWVIAGVCVAMLILTRSYPMMRLIPMAVVACLLSSTAIAAEKPDDELTATEKQLAEVMENYRDEVVAKLEERIKQLPRRPVGRQQTSTRRTISIRLRQARKADYLVPYIFPGSMAEDEIGYLLGGDASDGKRPATFEVDQVIDQQTMLVRPYGGFEHPIYGGWYNHPCETSLYVYGVSTKGIRDEQMIRLPQLFQCTGTKTYTTILGGSRTVFAVEPYAIEDPKPLIKKLRRR